MIVVIVIILLGFGVLLMISKKNNHTTMAEDKISIYKIRWYPFSKNFVTDGSKRIKIQQLPPLMVRKADWRG